MDFPIIVLISGRGSNLVNLAENARHFNIAAVVSNKEDAPGLAAAAQRGIKTIAVPRKDFPSVAEQKRKIFSVVKELKPKLVALAGYMQIVESYFLDGIGGQMVNIHPALLPKFPGLDTHQRALAGKETEHGCTVHFVDAGVDTGPIIAQRAVDVAEGDDAAALAARILVEEHRALPQALQAIAEGRVRVDRPAEGRPRVTVRSR